MFVAEVYDAVGADGRPYFSPDRHRLVHPELRSRVFGYLASAPVARPGHRSDGVWVWPESLARHVLENGVGPQPELLDHLAARGYLLPRQIPQAALVRAAQVAGGPATASQAPRLPTTYFAGHRGAEGLPAYVLRRLRLPDGTESESSFTPHGWEPSKLLATAEALGRRIEEVSQRRAADAVDQLSSYWYQRLRRLGAETVAAGGEFRVARVFDGEDPAGTPRFTPNRLRVVEPQRRERLAGYLAGGRLVLRAPGRVPDPLAPERGRAISLNYRTDGTWVWQEALSHYAATRGIAPELDLLCHIEERGYLPLPAIADDVAARAAVAAKARPVRRPHRESMVYYASYDDGNPRRLVRLPGGNPEQAEELDRHLRWRASSGRDRPGPVEDADNLVEIDEAEAIRVLDLWCERLFADLASR